MLGQNLQKLRKERGLTQTDFVNSFNKMFDMNIERSMISKWENESQQPMIYTVACIAQFFNVSIDLLLTGKEPAPQQLPPDEEEAAHLYRQLDRDDRGEIRGEMKHMLKAEKYKEKDHASTA